MRAILLLKISDHEPKEGIMSSRWERELIDSFITFFKLLGLTEEEAREKLSGISGEDLKNDPEIRRIIEEEYERNRKKEELTKAKKEEERQELLEKVKSLDSQITDAETERKKLLKEKDEILKSLHTNQ
jgi:hypothetical protein